MSVASTLFTLNALPLNHVKQLIRSPQFPRNGRVSLTTKHAIITNEVGPITCMDLEQKKHQMFIFLFFISFILCCSGWLLQVLEEE